MTIGTFDGRWGWRLYDVRVRVGEVGLGGGERKNEVERLSW